MTSNYPDRQQLFGLASGLQIKALIFSPLKRKEKKKDKIKKERERKGKKRSKNLSYFCTTVERKRAK